MQMRPSRVLQKLRSNEVVGSIKLNLSDPRVSELAAIMVPHIMNYEDAVNVVRQTRFHPIGQRPVDGGNADGGYNTIDFTDYLRTANEQRFVILQIEYAEVLDGLDAIAQLDGYDMLFFGPGDFSQSIGTPGQWDNPLIADARIRVVDVAMKYGKYAGTVGPPENFDDLVAMGYRFVNIGADVSVLSSFFMSRMELFHRK